jgi:gamma-glutamylcysteine synthetase
MEEYDLLQCVDKGLDPFGTNVKQSIYWKMSILHNYSRNEIIENPELLQNVIRETLSDSAISVEESITRQIRLKFDLSAENAQNLKEAINNAKSQIINVITTTVS